MFSILIPTFNNVKYLELCISSINKNSKYDHQIIAHVNIGDDGTINFLKKENIDFTYTKYNSGICEGINKAAKLAKGDSIPMVGICVYARARARLRVCVCVCVGVCACVCGVCMHVCERACVPLGDRVCLRACLYVCQSVCF